MNIQLMVQSCSLPLSPPFSSPVLHIYIILLSWYHNYSYILDFYGILQRRNIIKRYKLASFVEGSESKNIFHNQILRVIILFQIRFWLSVLKASFRLMFKTKYRSLSPILCLVCMLTFAINSVFHVMMAIVPFFSSFIYYTNLYQKVR